MDQIKQFLCGLTQYYAVHCTSYLKFICLHFAEGYPTSNTIFSVISRWNGLVLVFKWKLRSWGIQKYCYMSQYQLPNLSYKPLNIIGRIYLIAAVDIKYPLVGAKNATYQELSSKEVKTLYDTHSVKKVWSLLYW